MARNLRRTVRTGLALTALAVVAVGGWLGYRYHGPTPPVQVYRGITYGCDRLPRTSQGWGLVHWVRADLTAPGVRLYATPTDPAARAATTPAVWEYHLRHVSSTVAVEHLAAAVNGALFASDSWPVRLPGDLARSAETVVADGAVNHVDPNTYLLWWDRAGTARLETTKPPSAAVLADAAWAIGGQVAVVIDGRPNPAITPGPTDWRTAVAADPARHLVWIVCFDHASYLLAAQEMVRLGATVGILVDGGTSTTMALGPDARGVRPGTVTGNWRPVATAFGFRADPLPW